MALICCSICEQRMLHFVLVSRYKFAYAHICSYNLDFDGSAAKSGSSRRSRLSILGALGDDPLNMDSQLSDISLSLREEPESHPSLDRHLSQLPTSQVRVSCRCSMPHTQNGVHAQSFTAHAH